MSTNIKNLLFDLGGVIVSIDRNRCVRAYNEAGMPDADSMLDAYKQSGIFLQLEEGNVTPQQFRDELRKHFTIEVSDDTIDNCFRQFLLGIPLTRLRALEQLKEHYRIFIVSNTNAIMFETTIRDYFKTDGHTLEYYADDYIVSYEEHCCKPDERIFKRCIEKFGIKPEETLFFDDGKANCEAAAQMGFSTHHVLPGTEFYEYFYNK